MRRFLQPGLRARRQRDVGARLGERDRDRPTEAAAGAGDQRDLTSQDVGRRGQR